MEGCFKAVVAFQALFSSVVNYIFIFSTPIHGLPPTIPCPLNTWVRFSPFTWINSSHLQFVKGSLAPQSTEEDNWIELILLADFSYYLKGLREEKHSQKKSPFFPIYCKGYSWKGIWKSYEREGRMKEESERKRWHSKLIVCERLILWGCWWISCCFSEKMFPHSTSIKVY